MTQVDFHTGLADKSAYACRLVRKAWRSGQSVAVTGSVRDLDRLDQLLWVFDPGEFVPHLRLRAGGVVPARLARTPVWLVDALQDAQACPLLVNIGAEPVTEASRFSRVFELVGHDEADVAAGRSRWREHRAAGRLPQLHGPAAPRSAPG